MSMNINNPTAQNSVAIEKNKTQKHEAVKADNQASSITKQDSVQLTQQAKSLSNIKDNAITNEISSERIEALKSAIINGDYKVNVERLAEKLSQFENDFSKYHPT